MKKIISNYNAVNLTKNIALDNGASNTTIKRQTANYQNLRPVVIKTRAPTKGKPTGKYGTLFIMRHILKRYKFTSVT